MEACVSLEVSVSLQRRELVSKWMHESVIRG